MTPNLSSPRSLRLQVLLTWLTILCGGIFGVDTACAQSAHVVSFAIPPIAYATRTQHPTGLTITEAHIALGFVDVVDHTSMMINANVEQVAMQVHIDTPLVARASLRIAGRDFSIASQHGTLVLATRRGANQPVAITYRFYLNRGARPGMYAWPLALNVTPNVA